MTIFTPDPGTTSIGPGDVHAWLIDLDGWPAGQLPLNAAERSRAASYLRLRDGARFAASRAATRAILSGYVGCEPGRLRFAAGDRGQPRLAGHGLRFSLSRCGGVALLGVSPGPVGCDLERVRPAAGLADLIAARFTVAEAACIASGCAGSPLRSFYRHWVAKEAYLKATGRGLAGLRDTELACRPAPVIRVREAAEPAWKICLTEAPAGYLAAMVATQAVTAWRHAGRSAPMTPAAADG